MVNFLTLAEILLILEDQIKNYGGIYGIRDIHLLSSAIYVLESTFDGQYLHKTIPAMAAAYAFHICQNHPFLDGNKRVVLVSSLIFLEINRYQLDCEDEILYNEIMNVAKGEIKKEELIGFYKKYSKRKQKTN